jgi:hypothetical protein
MGLGRKTRAIGFSCYIADLADEDLPLTQLLWWDPPPKLVLTMPFARSGVDCRVIGVRRANKAVLASN